MSGGTAGLNRRKVGMTSSQHGSYVQGDTHATMVGTTGSEPARGSQSHQSRSQFGWQAATRLPEVGVASNRGSAHRGEYVPGPCTHRPSHHPSLVHPKSLAEPARDGGAEGVPGEGGEVVNKVATHVSNDIGEIRLYAGNPAV